MPRFVIQEHHARRLHWDFRLEMDGVLKSWAVPKQPTMQQGIKRLAIQVDDHPLDYIDFEGEIEEGQYGAGTVKIWDKGEYELLDRDEKHIRINLKGKKLKGVFTLIKMSWSPGNQWLLMKGKERKKRQSSGKRPNSE